MSAKVQFPKVQQFNTQAIDMADAQVALTWRAPTSGQVRIAAPVLLVDANSSGTEDLLLPIEAESAGITLQIVNTGGESIVVKEDSDTTTIATLAAGATGYFLCTGTAWKAVSPETTDFGSGGIAVDVIAESTAAAGVTIDGLLIKDERIQVTGAGVSTGDAGVTLKDNLANAWDFKESTNAYLTFVTTNSAEALLIGKPLKSTAGMSAVLDVSSAATGESDVVLADNLASAFEIREAANTYLTFVTTNDAERINFGKLAGFGAQIIDMADAQVALVLGTAGAGEVKLTANTLFVDANSSGTEDLLLPPEAASSGLVLDIFNTGGESIVVKEDSDTTTIVTIATTKSARVGCDGTTWFAIAGA